MTEPRGGPAKTSRAEFEDLDPFRRDGGPLQQRSWSDEYGRQVSAWLLALGGDRKITRPFLQNPWVYACVTAIARAVSSARFAFMKGEGGDRAEVETSMTSVLAGPNPIQSQKKFLKQLTNYHLLWGETYLLLLKRAREAGGNGKPARTVMVPVDARSGEGLTAKIETPEEIWPIAGHLVDEVIDDDHGPLPWKYKVSTSKGTREYPAHAIVPITDANPYSVLRGVGPMTAALRDAAKAYQVDRYDEALLNNGGTPGGVLSIDGPLTDAELRAIRSSWREAQERPDSHRKTAILPYGTKYESFGFSPQEMEFADFREWIRQTIMAVYGVTKPILGITDDVNRANSREAYRVFWETTVMPLVRLFEDELNYRLVSRLAEPGYKNTELILDTSEIEALREDLDAKVERTLKIYSGGHRTFQEASVLGGWDLGDVKVDGADERWIDSSLVPPEIALAGPPDQTPPPSNEPPPEPGDDEEASIAATVQRVARESDLAAYWRAHDAFLRSHESRFARTVGGVYGRFLTAVDDRLVEIAGDQLAAPPYESRYVVTESELERLLGLNLDEWTAQLTGAVEPRYLAVISEAARRLGAEIGGSASILTATDPEVLDFLRVKRLSIAEGWLTNLAASVQRNLVAALAEAPASLPTLAHAIADVLAELRSEVRVLREAAGRRAIMIARTEVTSASSFARVTQMRRDEIDQHTWVASRDDATRAHHSDLDGRTVAVGQVFGYGLRYPGDPNASAGEIINCRCTTVPELPERAVPAPNWHFDFAVAES